MVSDDLAPSCQSSACRMCNTKLCNGPDEHHKLPELALVHTHSGIYCLHGTYNMNRLSMINTSVRSACRMRNTKLCNGPYEHHKLPELALVHTHSGIYCLHGTYNMNRLSIINTSVRSWRMQCIPHTWAAVTTQTKHAISVSPFSNMVEL